MSTRVGLGGGGGGGGLSIPDLSGSDLPEGMYLTHFELVHHNNHYDCVVSEDDLISNSFPIMNVECVMLLCL